MKTKTMKHIIAILICVIAPLLPITAADGPDIGLEPYGTISWAGIDGQADLGAGANLRLGITKNLSVVGFGESDDYDGLTVERLGAGLRYTANLGNRVSLDAGVGGAYDIANDRAFLRLPLGANLYAVKGKDIDAGLRVQYAFDITSRGHNGTSTGRLFAGPVLNLRF